MGFAVLILVTMVMGALALRTLSVMSTLTDEIFDHSMTVIDEVQQARLGVARMYGEGQRLLQVLGPEDVEGIAARLAELDRQTVAHLENVRRVYQGNPQDVTEALLALDERRRVRQVSLQLMREGRREEAVANVLNHGMPAEAVVEQKVVDIVTFARDMAWEKRAAANAARQEAFLHVVGALLVLTLLGLFLAVAITRGIVGPLGILRHRMQALAAGDLSIEVPFREGRSEVSMMARAVQVLKDAAGRLEGQHWVKAHLAQLGKLLQQAATRRDLCQTAIETLVPLLKGGVGAFYVWDEDGKVWRLTGGYGVTAALDIRAAFAPGEGLVGQAALGGKPILLTDLPGDYPRRINSGMGDAVPGQVLVVPLMTKDKVVGVIEIGAFGPFTAEQQALIEEAAPLIALNLEILERNEHTRLLLDQTQKQAEELRASEEELRAQSDQLQAANEELRASEEELRAQREELQATNEELEEKARQMDEQAKILEIARMEADHRALERETASRYKSEFLANMSHELRTPLNSLLILARSLADNEEGNLSADQVDSARVIEESGTHLLRLLNDILDLSKVEAGKMEIVASAIEQEEFTESIRRRFRRLAEAKGLTFTVEAAADLPAAWRSDRGKIDQILNNLVSNAIKFTESGGISVRLERPRDVAAFAIVGLDVTEALAIEVADSGIGIPSDQLSRIFEAFEQVDGSASRRYGGTGLGLSISRKLARFLGGDVLVSSVEGEGSVFTLVLPLTPALPVPAEQAESPALPPPPKPAPFLSPQTQEDDRDTLTPQDETILVIEDDPAFARIICDLARKRGFKCLLAGDGMAGLELAKTYRPTGIVLDVGLPRLDGWTVMERLKQAPETRHIPVHFMSAHDGDGRGLDLGAVGFATKPVSREVIEGVLDRLRHSGKASEPRRVLLVEDDPATRKAVTTLLRGREVEISEADSGEKAMELLRQGGRYDCLILDLGLPDIDGVEWLDRCVRENLTLPPVVVYSARDLTAAETLALREHTDSIVIKGGRAPERLLDEVTLFLHSVQSHLPEGQQMALRAQQAKQEVGSGCTVLVVDDDMRNAFALSKVLRAKGLKVLMAQDGQKALAQLDEAPQVDCVLMDIMMPGMDGYQTMREIRRHPRFKTLPIIALTAKAMPGDRDKCIQAGATEYMSKPVEIDALLALMRNLVMA